MLQTSIYVNTYRCAIKINTFKCNVYQSIISGVNDYRMTGKMKSNEENSAYR